MLRQDSDPVFLLSFSGNCAKMMEQLIRVYYCQKQTMEEI